MIPQSDAPWRAGGGGGGYSFDACLSHLTTGHVSLSRRSTVPTPNRDAANDWALITSFPYITHNRFAIRIPFLFIRLWPPSISEESDRFLAAIYQTPTCLVPSSPLLTHRP